MLERNENKITSQTKHMLPSTLKQTASNTLYNPVYRWKFNIFIHLKQTRYIKFKTLNENCK